MNTPEPEPKPSPFAALGTFLVGVYLVGVFIAMAYFNWQFAQHSGFAKWLLFGQIIPTLQAIVWPIYFVKYLLS